MRRRQYLFQSLLCMKIECVTSGKFLINLWYMNSSIERTLSSHHVSLICKWYIPCHLWNLFIPFFPFLLLLNQNLCSLFSFPVISFAPQFVKYSILCHSVAHFDFPSLNFVISPCLWHLLDCKFSENRGWNLCLTVTNICWTPSVYMEGEDLTSVL